MADIETTERARSLVDLIEQMHRAASEAAALGFPRMARQLDDCGFALASEIADKRISVRAAVDRARRCLQTWWSLRDW